MGARLVKAAYVLQYPLLETNAARVVLGYMCVTALDDAPDPVYFAGNAPLALALGYTDPTAATAQRAVSRALAELERLDCIETSPDHPRNHKRRRFLTIARPVENSVDNPPTHPP